MSTAGEVTLYQLNFVLCHRCYWRYVPNCQLSDGFLPGQTLRHWVDVITRNKIKLSSNKCTSDVMKSDLQIGFYFKWHQHLSIEKHVRNCSFITQSFLFLYIFQRLMLTDVGLDRTFLFGFLWNCDVHSFGNKCAKKMKIV